MGIASMIVSPLSGKEKRYEKDSYIRERRHRNKIRKEEKTVKKPKHHIFVCGSFRAHGAPQGVCNKKDSLQLLQYLEQELSDRGMTDVSVSSTGCLKLCDMGPAMIIYPQNWWYGMVETEAALDEIIDALEEGQPAVRYLLDGG
jgi:(2Fe-2S) ferredoxin